MKRCPACQQTFPDDAPDFCPNDGMRLVNEEAATFDPEKTMMASGGSVRPPQPAMTPPAEPPRPFQQPPPVVQPQAPQMPQPPMQQNQQPPPPQQWQPQGGVQNQQQAGWPPAPVASPSQPPPAPQAWGNSPFQPQPSGPPYGAPFVPPPTGRSRALAIAAIVFGVDAATIMALTVIRDRDFARMLMFALPILAIVLGVTALFLALKKPSRFGGVELAIAGLALGVAGLVYILMRGF